MSLKITVKRTKKYIRFFYRKIEIFAVSNCYADYPEYTDESLIRWVLRPWLVDSLKENRSEFKKITTEKQKLDKQIRLQAKVLKAYWEQ